MIKKPLHSLDRSPGPMSGRGEEELADNLLGKRSSPPTDVTVHHQPQEESGEGGIVEVSDQLDQAIKRARAVLEPKTRPGQGQSIFELLERFEDGPETGEVERLLSERSPAMAAAEGFAAVVTARDARTASCLYKLFERQTANLKWRPDGR